MLSIKIPGKLYLIGEYNVLNDGKSAILFTVDKYVTAMIEQSKHFVLVNEKEVHPLEIEKGIVRVDDDNLKISQSAMQIALNYLEYLNIPLQPFRLSLTNQLVSTEGLKYGLGSSAAILIAILKSILMFHRVKLTRLELFKIAVLGQYLMDKKTSGGDLAACSFGGMICYTRYEYAWLKNNVERGFDIVKETWPLLDIVELPPQHFNIQIGWTNSPYSTNANLAKILHQERIYLAFTNKANELVLRAKNAIIQGKTQELGVTLSRYQDLLYKLDFDLELGFNTAILNTLIKIGNEAGGFAKISGAGYGDCGICLIANEKKLLRAWKRAGISPLKYHIAPSLGDE